MTSTSMTRMVKAAGLTLLLSLMVTSAIASVVSLQNGSVNSIGGIAPMNLTLDAAPGGFSGYSMNVSFSDPTVAEVYSVSFPAWATMKSNTTLPLVSCRLKAADIGDQITTGATSVPLGTLFVRGKKTGSTSVVITINKLDNDAGSAMTPVVQNGTFTVILSPSPPPGITIRPR